MNDRIISTLYDVWPDGFGPEHTERIRCTLVSSLRELGYLVDKDNRILRKSELVGFTDKSGRTLRVIHCADDGTLEHFALTYEYKEALISCS